MIDETVLDSEHSSLTSNRASPSARSTSILPHRRNSFRTVSHVHRTTPQSISKTMQTRQWI